MNSDEKNSKGLVIVYTGNGKGKTTAALGIVFRALGRGLKCGVVQFLKVNGKPEKKCFQKKYQNSTFMSWDWVLHGTAKT
ncbi:corrinoid adenosyltransferase domain protein [Leptospira interrogans serovar Copenhageni str. LT2050]|uniref:corrinoid adenosyltransferase n=1 Tax=Leptospira interrogans serovar Copenhageni str. LT2050 TaxID=1001598 RepID=M3HNH3_LEPIT|nr:corrinoid adenosyltransferase domain protein [Leptospira interrogans serovar Copenhageni str. LT2050]